MKLQKISSSSIRIVKQEVIQKITDSQFEDYKKLGIRKLRVIGASWGVKSPTSRKKDDLLNEMNLIRKGEKKQHFSLATLNLAKEKEGYGNFNKNEMFSNSLDTFNDSIIFDFGQNNFNLKSTGYFELGDEFDLVKNYDNGKIDCYIMDKNFSKSFSLKEGDYLEVFYNINDYKEKYVFGLNKINDNKLKVDSKYKLVDFDDLECCLPKENLDFGDLNILKGSRNFIKITDNRYFEINDILSKINNKQYNFVMAINESPEIKSLVNKNFKVYPITKTLSDNDTEITSYISNLKRRVEEGEDTLLVVLNFNKFYEYVYNKHLIKLKDELNAKIETDLFVKEFLYLGRDCKNAGSITLIVFNDKLNSIFEECFNNIM